MNSHDYLSQRRAASRQLAHGFTWGTVAGTALAAFLAGALAALFALHYLIGPHRSETPPLRGSVEAREGPRVVTHTEEIL